MFGNSCTYRGNSTQILCYILELGILEGTSCQFRVSLIDCSLGTTILTRALITNIFSKNSI